MCQGAIQGIADVRKISLEPSSLVAPGAEKLPTFTDGVEQGGKIISTIQCGYNCKKASP
jgi:hypothetical protein